MKNGRLETDLNNCNIYVNNANLLTHKIYVYCPQQNAGKTFSMFLKTVFPLVALMLKSKQSWLLINVY